MTIVEEIQLLLERMSYSEALKVLGLSGSPDEPTVQKAWKKLAFKYHPDRAGGDAEMMQQVNQARDTLLNMGTAGGRPSYSSTTRTSSTRTSYSSSSSSSSSSSQPGTAQPAKDPPPVDGEKSLRDAFTRMPTGVEWLFVASNVYIGGGSEYEPMKHIVSNYGTILYGRTSTHHVFAAIKRVVKTTTATGDRRAISQLPKEQRYKANEGYQVLVMPSPISISIQKAGLKSIKALADHIGWANYRRMEFLPWDDKMQTNYELLFNTKGKKGFPFKSILEMTNVVETEGERRSEIELVGSSVLSGPEKDLRKERYGRVNRKGQTEMDRALWYDWTIEVDGKPVRTLTTEEVADLAKANFFFSIYGDKPYFAKRVNLTKKRGSSRSYSVSMDAKDTLELLAKHLKPGGLKNTVEATVRTFRGSE